MMALKHPNPDACIACTTCVVQCPVAQATTNFLGPRIHQSLGPLGDRPGRINHVVYDDDILVGDVTYCSDGAYHVRPFTGFVADDYRTLEITCVCIGPFGSSHVRSGYGKVFYVLFPEVRQENGTCVDMVHRKVEEALDLVGVEVACHDPVASGGVENVRHELGSDGNPRLVFPVLPGPAEIRHYSHDRMCRSPFGRIYHQQEFEKVLYRREGRLHNEYGGSSHTFVE